jgi:predicted nucleotidyltransferase
MKEKYLSMVKQIILNHLTDYPAQVYLFGSWVNGNPTHTSDIDVGIMPLEPFPPGLFSRIREDLEESRIPYQVDLIDLSKTETAFREKIQKEGILWTDYKNV